MTEFSDSVGPAVDSDWPEIGRLVERAQRDPARHVTYVGEQAATILAEFAEAPHWQSRCVVIRDAGVVTSVLLCDVDEGKRRAYWLGPWGGDEESMAKVLDEARSRFGDLFDEEELAPDARNALLAEIAAARGFRGEPQSDVLSRRGLEIAPMTSLALDPGFVDAVAALHDSLFPGTHRSGDDLTEEGTYVRCFVDAGTPVGYVAYQVEADGSGYIDYLGVAPTARRRGLARALIRDACSALATLGVSEAHLTVRVDAQGASQLYQSEGFVRERTIAPYRRGFSLD